MRFSQKPVLFFLFFISGFCGLLYQVVWLRLAFASFGILTAVMSVVISVFMLGLFLGSVGAGKIAKRLEGEGKTPPIFFYAGCELLIAVGAFAVPLLFATGERWLLNSGTTDSFGYLFQSALVIAGSIFPWCVFMGATFPFMMGHVKRTEPDANSFSFLYLANVIGAMTGTLATAVVLVEKIGFSATLDVAAGGNCLIALVSLWLARITPRTTARPVENAEPGPAPAEGAPSPTLSKGFIYGILFLTGFVSMAMEVIWTRDFTPVLQTAVYSFAMLLFTYLLATWIGSLFYRRSLERRSTVSPPILVGALSVTALFPILLGDPRLHLNAIELLATIIPFCAVLGYLTPQLIDIHSQGRPERAGIAYAVNISGCILGPLFASYLMLPALGVKFSLLLLSVAFFLVTGWRCRLNRGLRRPFMLSLPLACLCVVLSVSYEDDVAGYRGHWRRYRDSTATVLACGTGMERWLLVNGMGMTELSTATKVMAHLPLALLPERPKSALVICFGMGTTFRSLLAWEVDATAIELVPGVKKAFGFYHEDAEELVRRPNAHIIIDDGRRYLKRSTQKFDLITLDPPPPVEAAGSSLLYSEEFYALVKRHLTEQGLLQQWFPGGEDRIIQAALRSLENSFKCVRIYHSNRERGGFHFVAADHPIPDPSLDEMFARIPEAAKRDMMEWEGKRDARSFFKDTISQRMDAKIIYGLQQMSTDVRITDDRPYNEYFLLRRERFGDRKVN